MNLSGENVTFDDAEEDVVPDDFPGSSLPSHIETDQGMAIIHTAVVKSWAWRF